MSALIYCPFPDVACAERIGAQLLDERLIVCINIGSGIHSLFAWGGERGESDEVPALLKTEFDILESTVRRLEELHPYDAPTIFGWRCEVVGAATREWLAEAD